MSSFCKTFVLLVAALYAFAVSMFLAGTFGWFGVGEGPLASIFLIPLGLPWNLLVEYLPEPAWPFAAVAAPALNLALLVALCRASARRAR